MNAVINVFEILFNTENDDIVHNLLENTVIDNLTGRDIDINGVEDDLADNSVPNDKDSDEEPFDTKVKANLSDLNAKDAPVDGNTQNVSKYDLILLKRSNLNQIFFCLKSFTLVSKTGVLVLLGQKKISVCRCQARKSIVFKNTAETIPPKKKNLVSEQ